MPIYIGTSDKNQQQIALGTTQMQKVYVGDRLVWSKPTGFTPVNYGLLYNWYAAADTRYIANVGWHVASNTEHEILRQYVGTTGGNVSNDAGGYLKESGLLHWNSPNSAATNTYLFNLRGSGYRNESTGVFLSINNDSFLLSSTSANLSNCYSKLTQYNSISYSDIGHNKRRGASIRLLKDSTTLTHGQAGIYLGNDGKTYRTICIGNQEFLAYNLTETKFRNGDWIHGFEGGTYSPISNTDWAALTTEGCCAWGDNLENI